MSTTKCRSKMAMASSSAASLVVVIPLLLISVVAFFLSSSYQISPSPTVSSSSSRLLAWKSDAGGTFLSPIGSNIVLAATAPAPAPASLSSAHGDLGPAVSKGTSLSLSGRKKRPDHDLERLELVLARARSAIRGSIKDANQTSGLRDPDYTPKGPIYRNALAFHRSYLEMEKVFKVYVYEEGEPPLFHDGPCKSIYSMEGRFIHSMEMENRFRTRDPATAHVHFLPFSVSKMVDYVYERDSFDIGPVKNTIMDYVSVVSERYPYWNRSQGADHFMLSCHDWGPHASAATSRLYGNSIRVLCNANTSEGFSPARDVSLPEINLKTGLITSGVIGGPSPSRRPVLAFFAGGLHGPIRPVLLEHWRGRDDDIQVHEYLPQGVSYYDMMRKSRFCICPSGYEVASPRIVEAIYLECVPVVISDHYVLPFSDVLNWRSFAVHVTVKEVPDLKRILTSISPRQYIRMQRRVRKVQRHFVVSSPPQRFDVFHMILHSVWLRRLNVRITPDGGGSIGKAINSKTRR